MRIGDMYSKVGAAITPPASQATSKAKDAAATSASDQAAAQGAVKVSVSAKAMQLSQASSDADEAKVSRLKSAIADGSFTIDSAKIASKIVDGG
jgi:negative regulator of flagellin synthesis FlgM